MSDDAPLGAPLERDELALDVAEARVAAKLFGTAPEVTVGRYKLLELIGRGGMGVVWGAWDPELERKVAIKVVDRVRAAARDRIADEARALAKLSHPNVVAVHDVGVVDDRVYLVMEWVPGETLRERLRAKHGVRTAVELYLQAARGLAAVHDAGLVHRDFKPENAMVGRDGRVRVLDFGLARADLADGAAEIAGTPRYMAPEQVGGATPAPTIDQYALCVALREALPDPPPRWLAAIVGRGTATRPGDRFASMTELVAALERDPRRVWTRRIAIAGLLGATAAAFAIGRAATADVCADASSVVPDETRARIAAHLDSLGGLAARDRMALVELIAARDAGLASAKHDACIAHERHELPTAMYERRLACLSRAGSSLAAISDIVLQTTPGTFADARGAVAALIEPRTCARVDGSLAPQPAFEVQPAVRAAEAAIERARLLGAAARRDAPGVADVALRLAEATSHEPAIARALLVAGRVGMVFEDPRAPETLDRAMRTAFAAHDDATAVEAFARRAYLIARQEGRVVDGTTLIQAVAASLGPDGTFARLLLLNNLASVRMSTDDPKGARELLETALRDWRPGHSEDDYELVSIPQNLALVADSPARSVALLDQARAEVVRLFGVEHPKVIEIDEAKSHFLELPRARAITDDTCHRLAQFPELRGERAVCEYEAGWLADEAGDRAAASAHFAAAAFDVGIEPLRDAIVRALVVRSNPAELERAAAASAGSSSIWVRVAAGDAYIGAARLFGADRTAARRCWAAARAIFEALDRTYSARRLARARANLAVIDGDREAARAALAWYRAVGQNGPTTVELAAIAGTR